MATSPLALPNAAARPTAPWGMLAAIDLHDSDRARLSDPDSIRRFVPALIDTIGMRAHGSLMIDRFGNDELEGGSAGDELTGGEGNDRVEGNVGSDDLDGGVGADKLIGGPGSDSLTGGTQYDRLIAGKGNDRLDSVDGIRDLVKCGKGNDAVVADPGDPVQGCERIRRDRPDAPRR